MSKKRTNVYWKKRFEALEAASNSYGLETFRQIEPAFDKAQKEIQGQIESWYGRYAKNNKITMTEARRQLSTTELKEFRWDVKEYIKYGRENDLNQMWMKELENASAKVHVSRLEALKVRTQHAAEVAFGNELDCIDGLARKVFTEDYYHTIFEVQKGFGIGWEIGQIDSRKLDMLISKPWTTDNKTFKDRIWQSKNQMVSELHNQLTRTCILGKAPDDAIRALTKYVDKDIKNKKYVAGRLVMTEQAYFHSVAQKEAFNDLDVEEFEVVATLDSHTSEICQEMDGQHFPMTDYQPGVTAPPFHVWCRSVTVPYFEDNYTGERAARDEDGNTYYVPDSMTYKDWKNSMVDGNTDGLEVLDKGGKIDLKDKIQKVKNDITANGDVITEEHIKEAGKAVQDEITTVRNPLKTKWDEAQAEYDASDIKKQIDAALQKKNDLLDKYLSMDYFDPDKQAVKDELFAAVNEFDNLYNRKEAVDFREKIHAAKRAYEGTWEFNADELKGTLGQFRTMGVGSHDLKKEHYAGRGTLRDIVTTAYDHYPSDWVEASIKKGSLKISKVQRGFYNGSEIAISGYGTKSQISTAFHELGHRFEDVIKGIYEAEDVFYKRRTAGCPLEWLGSGYSRDEKTRKDDFLHSYMGKEYPDRFYELVSMGFERAYTNPTVLWKDEDYAQFIYGILALF